MIRSAEIHESSSSVQRLLLTPKEAAAALSISARSLWTLTDTGVLKAVRIGRSVRYAVADLEAYIDRCRSGPV